MLFCVQVLSVVPIFCCKFRINFSMKLLVIRDLFLKSFLCTFNAQICTYACLVNKTQYFYPSLTMSIQNHTDIFASDIFQKHSTETWSKIKGPQTWKIANMMQLRGLLLENSATWKILRPHLFKSFSSCKDKVNKIITNPFNKLTFNTDNL